MKHGGLTRQHCWSSLLLPLRQNFAVRTLSPARGVPLARVFRSSSRSGSYETSASSLVNRFPDSVQPYMRLVRLDRPIGSWLLFWPCAWSISMAGDPGALPSMLLLAKFGVGSVVMRGAGCTVNDLWDRDIDKQVSNGCGSSFSSLCSGCPHSVPSPGQWRHLTTPSSCLPSWPALSGSVCAPLPEPVQVPPHHPHTPPPVMVSLQCSDGCVLTATGAPLPLHEEDHLLATSLPWYGPYDSHAPRSSSLLPSPLPSFSSSPSISFLSGLTFNWGALMGYSAVMGYCDWSVCLPLYTGCFFWTLLYDTIYAFQVNELRNMWP